MRITMFFVIFSVVQISRVDAGIIQFESPTGDLQLNGDYVDQGFTFSVVAGSSLDAGIDTAAVTTGGNDSSNVFTFLATNTIKVDYAGPGTFTLVSLGIMKQTSAGVNNPLFTINGFDAANGAISTYVDDNFGNNLVNVTSLLISSTQDAAFDKFDFTINLPAAVPEPASAAFLGLGSLALVVRRLRRRTSVVA
jgi:hypothetical protein